MKDADPHSAVAQLEGDRTQGLNSFTDEGQRIAYWFGWAHAIQAALKLIPKAEPSTSIPERVQADFSVETCLMNPDNGVIDYE